MKYSFIIVGIFFALNSIAQSVVVQPYLQNLTEQSVVVMWETEEANSWHLDWGVDQTFGQSLASQSTSLLNTGNFIQRVKLTGLVPSQRYFYSVRNNNYSSAVFSFKTNELTAQESKTVLVAASDMQKDHANPNKFNEVVVDGIIPYFTNYVLSPINEHIDFLLFPGDLVDDGSNHHHWTDDFFDQGKNILSYIPLYPVLGNHERDHAFYFNYFELPNNGTHGFEEHWWYKDHSNIRIIGMDSNGDYRIQEQLDWLDSILSLTASDTTIDFVFVQLHHPHHSELWPEGNTSFTGEMIDKMEAFSSNSGKPSIHFFGHTHGYSRGQSRDHQHLMVNVASGGGNIDYWDEYFQQDYEEYIISQDEYGFVIVEAEAGEHPKFVLKRISLGNEHNLKNNTTEDSLVISLNNQSPETPEVIYPIMSDSVNPEDFDMNATPFMDYDMHGHGASHWQVSSDSINYTNSIVDRWVQYKNLYKDQDSQEGIDLSRLNIKTLLPHQTYCARVRYRDKGLKWSNWSNSVQFHTKAFSQWVLFPNPTTSTLRVNIPLNKQQHMSVLLYNQKGKVVQTFDHIHPPVWTYDTSTLKNGNYVVQFEKDGLVLASLKFIVL